MFDAADTTAILTSTKGQRGLPRYFAAVFQVATGLARGRLDFTLPDGRRFRAGGLPGPKAEIIVHNRDTFGRVLRDGDLGFFEGYMEGWWSTPDLMALMELIQMPENDRVNDGFPGMGLVRGLERMRFWLHRNSRRQARENIRAHYDLGNDFYGLWLDETMTYSSALFTAPDQPMADAQIAKYAQLVDQLNVKAGDHVLEVGCGWGGFCEYAAGQRGLRVTALTISQAQFDYAVARIAKAGLSDLVTIKLQDYRDEVGQYDAIASIEMFEAVGEAYWPSYFATLERCLKSGARASLQIITIADRRWQTYRKQVDFIQRYIFPGGMLPSPSVLRDKVAQAGLTVQGSIEFGQSYAETLRRWYDTFNAKWDTISAMGFDERFRRMWNCYLTSCAGAFQGGNCDVTQITISKP